MQSGFVYILESPNCKRYYIGSTIDPVVRLMEHNKGTVTATKNKGPWEIVFLQQYEQVSTARKIEYRLKRMKNRQIIKRIIADQIITLQI